MSRIHMPISRHGARLDCFNVYIPLSRPVNMPYLLITAQTVLKVLRDNYYIRANPPKYRIVQGARVVCRTSVLIHRFHGFLRVLQQLNRTVDNQSNLRKQSTAITRLNYMIFANLPAEIRQPSSSVLSPCLSILWSSVPYERHRTKFNTCITRLMSSLITISCRASFSAQEQTSIFLSGGTYIYHVLLSTHRQTPINNIANT